MRLTIKSLERGCRVFPGRRFFQEKSTNLAIDSKAITKKWIKANGFHLFCALSEAKGMGISMKVTKKASTGLIALLFIICIAVVAGCSGDKEEKSADQTQSESTNVEKGAETADAADAADGAAVNVGKFPLVDEPITLTAFGRKFSSHAPWKDVFVLKEYEKMTNIKMEYEEAPVEGYEERKNLRFASGDYPDIFFTARLTSDEIVRYGMVDKVLRPFDDLIDKYAPNVAKILEEYPEVRQAITEKDGHIYGLPKMRLSTVHGTPWKPLINKEWLAKLNLEKPTTTDELLHVLRAFRDGDPNGNGEKDEIPMAFRRLEDTIFALSGSFGLGQQQGYYINIEDDKVKIWLTDPRFKELLQYLNQLYEEGLIWDGFVLNDTAKWISVAVQAKFGLMFNVASDPFPAVEHQYTGMAPIIGPHGDQLVGQFSPKTDNIIAFAMSASNPYPEASLSWVDYFYGEEGATFFTFGKEGETFHYENGRPYFNDSIKNDPRGMVALGEIAITTGGGTPNAVYDRDNSWLMSPMIEEAQKFLDPYLPEKVYDFPKFDKDVAEKVRIIKADVDKYMSESVTKFIIGDLSFDKWDEYVSTLNKMKINELEQLYQDEFDLTTKK